MLQHIVLLIALSIGAFLTASGADVIGKVLIIKSNDESLLDRIAVKSFKQFTLEQNLDKIPGTWSGFWIDWISFGAYSEKENNLLSVYSFGYPINLDNQIYRHNFVKGELPKDGIWGPVVRIYGYETIPPPNVESNPLIEINVYESKDCGPYRVMFTKGENILPLDNPTVWKLKFSFYAVDI
eukprot:TRINITY_DN7935_c0_g1_i1.p1 TRINITY_DN7935_c0_g1~~TRINITY_DN7935_c0_g1_i1.p1  ORF type:complete len:182 (-),score=28.16 TRINITY_DN7935_c0_g1_i1:31-576(-)